MFREESSGSLMTGWTASGVKVGDVRAAGSGGLQNTSLGCLCIGGFPSRLNDGSRMSGDVHVRFYEGLGVKLPGATHLAAVTFRVAYASSCPIIVSPLGESDCKPASKFDPRSASNFDPP